MNSVFNKLPCFKCHSIGYPDNIAPLGKHEISTWAACPEKEPFHILNPLLAYTVRKCRIDFSDIFTVILSLAGFGLIF